MKQRRRHAAARPLRERFFLQPELDQHLQGRRMDGGGALVLRRVRQLLDERNRYALLGGRQRHHCAHRPRTCDDDSILLLHHSLHLTLLYITPSKSRTSRGGTAPPP